jgi:hypothetical protein
MIALIGPNPAALVRKGLSPKQAQALEKEWQSWDTDHGFDFRVPANVLTIQDRERLNAGEQPAPGAPPPPGMEVG